MNFSIINESAYSPIDVQLLEESTIGGMTKLRFKAKLQEKEVTNNNLRSYPEPTLIEIVNQLAPKASERKLLGEMDHPSPQGDDNAKLKRSSTISLQDVCVLYSKIEYDGRYIIAECETLTNDKGINLYRLLKDKVVIGFSLRAFGSSTKTPAGITIVNPQGIKALTFDVVSNPSHSNAVIYEFLNESTNPMALAQALQDHKKEVIEIITESTDHGMVQFNLDGEQVCACELNGSCVYGTLEESINYLIESSLTKNTIKKFTFKLQ